MDADHFESPNTSPSTPPSHSDGGEAPSHADARDATQRPDAGPRFWHRLFDPVDNGWLVYFRIFFGIEMLYTVWIHYDGGRLLWFSEGNFLFKYYGFEWVETWPKEWLNIHYIVMGVLSVLIIVGLFYRISSVLFFFSFTYIFLLDQTLYLNHYYLVCLLSLVMIFIPAHSAFSLDALFRRRLRSRVAPAWSLWLLKIQLGIPYFFGGIAKLNVDWLRGEPMHLWLMERTHIFPWLADFIETKEAAYCFSYGGILYDLLIVPMLLWRRTRLLGYAVTICFHMTNMQLFNIGIFPWLMMLGTLIYFPPHVPRRLLSKLVPIPPVRFPRRAAESALTVRQKATLAVIAAFLAFQFLFPFRHWLYPGHVGWTEEGQRFSWHMMLNSKRGFARFYAYEPSSGQRLNLNEIGYLEEMQIEEMAYYPDMILQFAHFLARQPDLRRELQRREFSTYEIRVESWISLNGRRPQHMIDPNVDLSRQPRTLGATSWIVPLKEPFRDKPFSARFIVPSYGSDRASQGTVP